MARRCCNTCKRDLSLSATSGSSFDETVTKVRELLEAEGFGVQLDMNVQGILKEKLGVAFERYRILGACNPGYAHQGLRANQELGLILPCNLVVYETKDGTVVSAIKPTALLSFFDDPQIEEIAEAVERAFTRVIDAIGVRSDTSPQDS